MGSSKTENPDISNVPLPAADDPHPFDSPKSPLPHELPAVDEQPPAPLDVDESLLQPPPTETSFPPIERESDNGHLYYPRVYFADFELGGPYALPAPSNESVPLAVRKALRCYYAGEAIRDIPIHLLAPDRVATLPTVLRQLYRPPTAQEREDSNCSDWVLVGGAWDSSSPLY